MFASVESHWPRNRHGERYVLGEKGKESIVLETSTRGDGKAFIDWLTVTFPVAAIDHENDWDVPEFVGTEDAALYLALRLEKILGFGIFQKRERGHLFYHHSWSLGEDGRFGFIAVGGQRATMLFELTGEGCMHAKPGWEAEMHAFLTSDALVAGALTGPKITRIDLTHDDHAGTYNVDRAFDDWNNDRFKLPQAPQSPAMNQVGNWSRPDGRGRTLYVGRRQSGKFLRVYEKGKQLGDRESPWTRIELELKAVDRVIPFDTLLKPGHYLAGAYPALEWLNERQSRISTVRHAAKKGYEAMVRYVRRAAGAALAVAVAINGQQFVQDLVSDVTADEMHRQMVKRALDLPTYVVADLAESDTDESGRSLTKGNDDVHPV